METILYLLAQIVTAKIFKIIITIVIAWLFIYSAIAAGTEKGTEKALNKAIKKNLGRFEFRTDENNHIYLTPKKNLKWYVNDHQEPFPED